MPPYKKSEPIPEENNEPVKVVVADSLQDIVFNSGKNGAYFIFCPSVIDYILHISLVGVFPFQENMVNGKVVNLLAMVLNCSSALVFC